MGKLRRVTELIELDTIDECRRAFGVYNLVKCMNHAPVEGKSYHIITGGAVDLIAHLQWLFLYYPKMRRILISAWAISGADILLLEKLYGEGLFESVEILVGDTFPSKYKMEWQKLTEMYEKGIVGHVYKSTIHSKLLLMESSDGDKLVIESSANCNMNPRVEQSCVTLSSKLFDFYDTYLHEMFAEEESRRVMRETTNIKDNGNSDLAEGLTLFG